MRIAAHCNWQSTTTTTTATIITIITLTIMWGPKQQKRRRRRARNGKTKLNCRNYDTNWDKSKKIPSFSNRIQIFRIKQKGYFAMIFIVIICHVTTCYVMLWPVICYCLIALHEFNERRATGTLQLPCSGLCICICCWRRCSCCLRVKGNFEEQRTPEGWRVQPNVHNQKKTITFLTSLVVITKQFNGNANNNDNSNNCTWMFQFCRWISEKNSVL